MAIKFDKVKPGMVLFDMSRWGCWKVEIVSVDENGAIVKWNGNRERFWPRRSVERLYTKETKAYHEQQERRRNGGL